MACATWSLFRASTALQVTSGESGYMTGTSSSNQRLAECIAVPLSIPTTWKPISLAASAKLPGAKYSISKAALGDSRNRALEYLTYQLITRRARCCCSSKSAFVAIYRS